MIQSPCIKVCTMDVAAGLCMGCGRTLDEIARWGSMSDAERADVMAILAGRLKRIDAQTGIVVSGERRE